MLDLVGRIFHHSVGLALMGTVSLVVAVQAQQAPFTLVVPEDVQHTATSERIVNYWQNAAHASRWGILEVNTQAFTSDNVRLDLFHDLSFTSAKMDGYERGVMDFWWYGSIGDDPRGYAHFTIADDRVAGSVQEGTATYVISPLGNGYHIVVEIDFSP